MNPVIAMNVRLNGENLNLNFRGWNG